MVVPSAGTARGSTRLELRLGRWDQKQPAARAASSPSRTLYSFSSSLLLVAAAVALALPLIPHHIVLIPSLAIRHDCCTIARTRFAPSVSRPSPVCSCRCPTDTHSWPSLALKACSTSSRSSSIVPIQPQGTEEPCSQEEQPPRGPTSPTAAVSREVSPQSADRRQP